MMYDGCFSAQAGRFVSHVPWIHPSVTIDTWEIIYVLEGTVYMNEAGTEYQVHPGEVLFLRPWVPHKGSRHSSNVEFYWLHFHVQAEKLPPFLAEVHQLQLRDAYYVNLLSRQLMQYKVTGYPAEACDYLIRLILMEVDRQRTTGSAEEARDATMIDRWLTANVRNCITVHEVARQFGYNEDYAARLYKKVYGVSLKKAINERKLQEIKSMLLTTTTPLREVSTIFGFREYKLFLKYFQYHEGISPTHFRALYNKMNMNTNNDVHWWEVEKLRASQEDEQP